jgi:hypothetical protein
MADSPRRPARSETYHTFRTWSGSKGTWTARADVKIIATADPGVFAVIGSWAVTSGTGGYATLHGTGTLNEVFDANAGTVVGTWKARCISTRNRPAENEGDCPAAGRAALVLYPACSGSSGLLRPLCAGRNGDGKGTGLHARLVSVSLALVTGWLLVWGAVAVAGTFSYLRPS